MRRYGAFEVTKDVYRVHEEKGFATPSGKLEIYSPTLAEWGWDEQAMPGSIESHVARSRLADGEMVLVPTFRLATLIHSRSANAPWLYGISHKNPLWMHPRDAERQGSPKPTWCGWIRRPLWLPRAVRPADATYHLPESLGG